MNHYQINDDGSAERLDWNKSVDAQAKALGWMLDKALPTKAEQGLRDSDSNTIKQAQSDYRDAIAAIDTLVAQRNALYAALQDLMGCHDSGFEICDCEKCRKAIEAINLCKNLIP